jgi:GNAT superfamily N-acetyltransferase
MIELRVAETDAELALWRSVRTALVPNERTASIAELRSGATFLLLAFRGTELAGSGSASKSDMGGGAVFPRVLPAHRRHGIGTALLQRLALHAEACGHDEVGSYVEDAGSFAFARRFGFAETGRQVEQVRTVAAAEPRPAVPDGVDVISVSDRPALLGRLYYELALQAFEDMPTPRRVEITPEQWEAEWLTWPEATFVALAGEEIVGMAGLVRDADRPERAENALTAVRRDWRGRGIARALKESAIAWAAAHGIREIYTWTQTGNENMRAVNERLGYVTRDVSFSVRRKLPL